jgi:hypothetical protein
MTLPGLTADASLYRTRAHYVSAGRAGAADGVRRRWPVRDPAGLPADLRFPAPGVPAPLSGAYGQEGGRCWPADARVPTAHCDDGFGCNVVTGRCEKCGEPGQPCCDGPHSAFSGRCYYGGIDGGTSCESCREGASCDARLVDGQWVGSRRCRGCGTTEGGPCCPPDVRYSVGRCAVDARSGKRLACDDPSAGAGGTCVACGDVDRPACASGAPCNAANLVEVNGVCRPCGELGQPACDGGVCRGLAATDDRGICVPAGGEGQICFHWAGPGFTGLCLAGLTCDRTRHCVRCGGVEQPCCADVVRDPNGSPRGRRGAQSACGGGLACSAGRCTPCGAEGQICCDGNSCSGLADCVAGVCRLHTRGPCARCVDASQCAPSGIEDQEAVCVNGYCRRHVHSLDTLGHLGVIPQYCGDEPRPKNPCEGVRCGPGETCFLGQCRTCGYPGGECCSGPIFGGCYGDLSCNVVNRCAW